LVQAAKGDSEAAHALQQFIRDFAQYPRV
jgi:hypothetical protein